MKKAIVVLAVAVLFGPAALADWDEGDPHKMHYPQLPDPNGWDVEISSWSHEIADDWMCSASGPVDDLHFWYSTMDDLPNEMDWVTATVTATWTPTISTSYATTWGIRPTTWIATAMPTRTIWTTSSKNWSS